MTTKEKILAAALELFNENGSDAVSVRDIAKKAGISAGNLCYHYPTVEEVIFALYSSLKEESEKEIQALQISTIDLTALYKTAHSNFNLLIKYKFLMLDFARIMRKYEPIKADWQQLVQRRRQQIAYFMQMLQQNEIIFPEKVKGNYELIIEQAIILFDFWLINAELLYDKEPEKMIEYYIKILLNSFVPLLTPKGLAEYRSLFNN